MAFYGSGIFYGSGSFYSGSSSGPATGIPIDLRFYRTSQDGVYVFWWGFNPAYINTSLINAGFDLGLDTAAGTFSITSVTDSTHIVVSSTAGMTDGNSIFQGSVTTTIVTVVDSTHLVVGSTSGFVTGPASLVTFASPNLDTFTQVTAITFQNGNIRKGFAVPVAARIDNTIQTWYARVRTHTPSFISEWSAVLIWTIPQSVQQSTAEALMKSLPDYHVYGKGDLLKPVDQRNTNLWLVENMYGNQLDQVFYATYLTQTDNYVDMAVDEVLYQNFGILFNFPKPISMQYVDYRWILMNLYYASLVGGTNEAIILIAQAFTGVPPAINNVRDINNFILTTTQDPPVVPSGPQTVFFTSTPFFDELVVQDLTTGLLVPSSSAYTADPAVGSWTMHVATTDTLQATFDTGSPIKVFDALSGATALTGTVTFTNSSTALVGTGTLFLSQLTIGDEITDPTGIYLGTVGQITDNTHVMLSSPWFGPTETVIAYRLLYTDSQLPVPILWDTSTLAFGIIVTIFNPAEIPSAFISVVETLIILLSPASTKIYFTVEV